MARINSLNILLTTEGKDKLAEEYGKVIENVQKACISQNIKNVDLSGDPTSGTVEAKRFANTGSSAYGTARAAGKGVAASAEPVTVAINTDRELINEVEDKDARLYGVDRLISRKAAQNEKSMQRELERAFFAEAATAGTELTTEAPGPAQILEDLIQAVETVQNDFVDGVERDMINVILTPAMYGAVRVYLDSVENNSEREAYALYHGAKVYSSVYLPEGYDAIAMADGSIAQPVLPTVAPAEKIPLSNAYAFGLFFSYGTKAVMPDLIFTLPQEASE